MAISSLTKVLLAIYAWATLYFGRNQDRRSHSLFQRSKCWALASLSRSYGVESLYWQGALSLTKFFAVTADTKGDAFLDGTSLAFVLDL